ncbi:MAG: hypothetical protein ABIJ45_04010, partial [Candidatus Zixiibacteriota bacterium]
AFDRYGNIVKIVPNIPKPIGIGHDGWDFTLISSEDKKAYRIEGRKVIHIFAFPNSVDPYDIEMGGLGFTMSDRGNSKVAYYVSTWKM